MLLPIALICVCQSLVYSQGSAAKVARIEVTSPAFTEGSMIPKKYTCDGKNVSPPFALSNIPAGAKSIALIADDPDARRRTWVHWVLFNLPPDTRELAEKAPASRTLANGAVHGNSSWGNRKIGYGGPCPPSGTHRYYFKFYALDTMLDLRKGATKKQLLNAMKGHIVGQGQLMGKYRRRR